MPLYAITRTLTRGSCNRGYAYSLLRAEQPLDILKENDKCLKHCILLKNQNIDFTREFYILLTIESKLGRPYTINPNIESIEIFQSDIKLSEIELHQQIKNKLLSQHEIKIPQFTRYTVALDKYTFTNDQFIGHRIYYGLMKNSYSKSGEVSMPTLYKPILSKDEKRISCQLSGICKPDMNLLQIVDWLV